MDATAWLDQVTASVVVGQYVDPRAGRVTFADFYGLWSARQVWEPGTKLAMDLAAATTFADVPMASIRRSHVEQWVREMVDRGLAAGSIHTRTGNVRAVFRGAVADRVISTDPTTGVALPRRRRQDAAMTIPTPAMVGHLLDLADGPFRAFIALCAFAGLRLGEAAGTQVGDVDFLGRSIRVVRQIQRADGGQLDIRPPKYGSERTVYVAPAVVTMLAEHVRMYVPERTDGGPRWLFRGDGSGPPHQNTVGLRWRSTLELAGLSGVKLHDLRHFYASGLIASGCDVVTVQRSLGHAKVTTTLDTYSHLWPTAEDRTRAAAESMVAEAAAAHAEDSVRTENPDKPLTRDGTPDYTLKRNSTTSPSCITYSLPSTRALPAARTAASEPASIRSS